MLLVVATRYAAWIRGARREVPQRIARVDDVHGRDQTVVFALDDRDRVRWIVGSGAGFVRAYGLHDPGAVGIDLVLARGARFERSRYEISLAHGEPRPSARAWAR